MYPGERFNSATHLIGVILAIAGSIVLLIQAVKSGNLWKIGAVSVFGLSMIALYGASTIYHSTRGPAKERWAKVDHCAIYVLIAGTYTPFSLITLQGTWGTALLTVVWTLAFAGIAKELRWGRERVSSVPLYLLMGWACVAVASPLIHALQTQGLVWLVTGGLLYTVGVIFYVMDTRWRHAHGVWHLFVLGGTASHYFTVLKFLV
ncbi:PAQR family membrane homeostasis protein TrhA [Aquabacterium sp.]|uniref:PAQR family membrane homeostasis protein TrhA n=1 Tax=Aquabacterium sp. TaxID=1872578 RepID=UPI002E36B3AD|nr:hemolysin III family protein [Aquabacterium sp.]HEX5311957.1 hemolysin III family protein [Aquabacterium sp.]